MIKLYCLILITSECIYIHVYIFANVSLLKTSCGMCSYIHIYTLVWCFSSKKSIHNPDTN